MKLFAIVIAAAVGMSQAADTAYTLRTVMEDGSSEFDDMQVGTYTKKDHDGNRFMYARPKLNNPTNFVIDKNGNLAPVTPDNVQHVPLKDADDIWAFSADEQAPTTGQRYAVETSDRANYFFVCSSGEGGMPSFYRSSNEKREGCDKVAQFAMEKVEMNTASTPEPEQSGAGDETVHMFDKLLSPFT